MSIVSQGEEEASMTQSINGIYFFFPPAYGKDNKLSPFTWEGSACSMWLCMCARGFDTQGGGFQLFGGVGGGVGGKGQILNTADKSTCGIITSLQRSCSCEDKTRHALWSRRPDKVVRGNLVAKFSVWHFLLQQMMRQHLR